MKLQLVGKSGHPDLLDLPLHGGNARFPSWAPSPKTDVLAAGGCGRARQVGRGGGMVLAHGAAG
jgi:hypothetical protein